MRQPRSAYAEACSTKAKREALARQVTELAVKHGGSVVQGDVPTDLWGPKSYSMTLFKGDYRVNMAFEGKGRVNAFLAHWHTASKSGAKYPADFGHSISGDVNTFHFAKATTVAYTVEGFMAALANGLDRLTVAK